MPVSHSCDLERARGTALLWGVALVGAVPGAASAGLLQDADVWYTDASLLAALTGVITAAVVGVLRLRSRRVLWVFAILGALVGLHSLRVFAGGGWLVFFAAASALFVWGGIFRAGLRGVRPSALRTVLCVLLALITVLAAGRLLFMATSSWDPMPMVGGLAAAGTAGVMWRVFDNLRCRDTNRPSADAASCCPTSAST